MISIFTLVSSNIVETAEAEGAIALKIEDLKSPPSNHLEKLKNDRKGQYSIRINDQYRICFEWTGTDAQNVEITDYH
jgi:toxin HigB-1